MPNFIYLQECLSLKIISLTTRRVRPWGENLLDQSVNSGRDSSEDVVVDYERVLGAPSPKIGCDEEDLFEDDGITDS